MRIRWQSNKKINLEYTAFQDFFIGEMAKLLDPYDLSSFSRTNKQIYFHPLISYYWRTQVEFQFPEALDYETNSPVVTLHFSEDGSNVVPYISLQNASLLFSSFHKKNYGGLNAKEKKWRTIICSNHLPNIM